MLGNLFMYIYKIVQQQKQNTSEYDFVEVGLTADGGVEVGLKSEGSIIMLSMKR